MPIKQFPYATLINLIQSISGQTVSCMEKHRQWLTSPHQTNTWHPMAGCLFPRSWVHSVRLNHAFACHSCIQTTALQSVKAQNYKQWPACTQWLWTTVWKVNCNVHRLPPLRQWPIWHWTTVYGLHRLGTISTSPGRPQNEAQGVGVAPFFPLVYRRADTLSSCKRSESLGIWTMVETVLLHPHAYSSTAQHGTHQKAGPYASPRSLNCLHICKHGGMSRPAKVLIDTARAYRPCVRRCKKRRAKRYDEHCFIVCQVYNRPMIHWRGLLVAAMLTMGLQRLQNTVFDDFIDLSRAIQPEELSVIFVFAGVLPILRQVLSFCTARWGSADSKPTAAGRSLPELDESAQGWAYVSLWKWSSKYCSHIVST